MKRARNNCNSKGHCKGSTSTSTEKKKKKKYSNREQLDMQNQADVEINVAIYCDSGTDGWTTYERTIQPGGVVRACPQINDPTFYYWARSTNGECVWNDRDGLDVEAFGRTYGARKRKQSRRRTFYIMASSSCISQTPAFATLYIHNRGDRDIVIHTTCGRDGGRVRKLVVPPNSTGECRTKADKRRKQFKIAAQTSDNRCKWHSESGNLYLEDDFTSTKYKGFSIKLKLREGSSYHLSFVQDDSRSKTCAFPKPGNRT